MRENFKLKFITFPFLINDLLLGIIHLVRKQNFPKNGHFLPPDTYRYRYINRSCKTKSYCVCLKRKTLRNCLSSFSFLLFRNNGELKL